MEAHHDSEHTGQPQHGYEIRDVNIPKLIGLSVGISVAILVAIVALNEIFMYTTDRIIYEQYLKPKSAVLARQQAHEDSVLAGYGVVNADSNVYRMPIEEAMRLTAGGAEQ